MWTCEKYRWPGCVARLAWSRRSRFSSPTQSARTSPSARTPATDRVAARVAEAAAVARLDKDVETFPNRYDTLVGERGITLSGGQKQRTALARALTVDPRILILDDALSAVDTYTEEEILSRLRDVMRQRTSIIVAHRISTVQHADQIFVLERGRIVERGRHEELVARGGTVCGHAPQAAPRGRAPGQLTMSIHDEEVLGKAYDARLMRRLLGYLRPYSSQVAIALAAIICGSILQLAQPWLMKLAIDRYIAAGNLEGLDAIALAFLGILLGSFAMEYVQTWILQMTGQRIMFDLRTQIYRHLQRLDLKFYDRNPVGRLMTRVTSDVDVLNDLFTAGVVSIFGDVFTLAGIMIVLVTMDWRLALVAFSVLPLIVLVTQWFRRNVRELYRVVRVRIARINAFLQEHITGMSTVQLFRRESRSFAKFDEINQAHRNANVDSIFYYAVFYPAIEIIGALASALIIWFGGGWTLQGTLTVGSLVAFLLYSQRFFRPISDMSEKFNVLQAAMASSERIFKLLDTPVTIVQLTANSPAQAEHYEAAGAGHPDRAREITNHGTTDHGKGHIVFDHVWFAYNDQDYVLRDVSFDVRPGERVGIVGATGAGKSTVINLLLRFYDVSRGRISIDGVDVRDMPLHELRRFVQPRPAGCASLFRHHRREHPPRERGDYRRAGRSGRRCRARRQFYPPAEE